MTRRRRVYAYRDKHITTKTSIHTKALKYSRIYSINQFFFESAEKDQREIGHICFYYRLSNREIGRKKKMKVLRVFVWH